MARDLLDSSITIADIFAVIAAVHFILIAIFTKNPCFSLVESYGVVTPLFTFHLGKVYKIASP